MKTLSKIWNDQLELSHPLDTIEPDFDATDYDTDVAVFCQYMEEELDA